MITWDDLHWFSDWDGEDVGYPDVLVVGLYSLKILPELHFYIDIENEIILEAFYLGDDE